MKQGVLIIVWEAVKTVFCNVYDFLLGGIESPSKLNEEIIKINDKYQEVIQKNANILDGLTASLLTIDEAANALNTLNEIADWVQEQPGKYTEIEKEKPKIHNCKNCGAPLHNNKCEYCGTEY